MKNETLAKFIKHAYQAETPPEKLDKRHTVTREFTGHISGKPQFVARFCGEWCGSRGTVEGALELLEELEALRHDQMAIDISLIMKGA